MFVNIRSNYADRQSVLDTAAHVFALRHPAVTPTALLNGAAAGGGFDFVGTRGIRPGQRPHVVLCRVAESIPIN